MPPENIIKVLVVDDSRAVRRMIRRMLMRSPGFEVIAEAGDPFEARDRILELRPDVLTLDLEMPRMDGLTFLDLLREQCPIPVVVVSSLTQPGTRMAMEALERGAIDVMAKPAGSNSVPESEWILRSKVRAAAEARHRRFVRVPEAKRPATLPQSTGNEVLLLGASTGGTEALKTVLTALPASVPPICIVQHLPTMFTRSFAERLDSLCAFEVREAVHRDVLRPGLALVAPGGQHMALRREAGITRVVLLDTPPVWHQRPAVDVLFRSACSINGIKCVAGILTGMGKDGAAGMLQLKEKGAHTIAQDEESCVVYGMPRAAVEAGGVQCVVPLDGMAEAISTGFRKISSNKGSTLAC